MDVKYNCGRGEDSTKEKVNLELLEFDAILRKSIGKSNQECICCIEETMNARCSLADHDAIKESRRKRQLKEASQRYRDKIRGKYERMCIEKEMLIKDNRKLEQKAEHLYRQIEWLKGVLKSKN